MMKFTLMMELINLGKRINEIAQNYMKATSDMERSLILVNANALKSAYAEKIITKNFPIEAYETMFRVKESQETKKHYIELYISEA